MPDLPSTSEVPEGQEMPNLPEMPSTEETMGMPEMPSPKDVPSLPELPDAAEPSGNLFDHSCINRSNVSQHWESKNPTWQQQDSLRGDPLLACICRNGTMHESLIDLAPWIVLLPNEP